MAKGPPADQALLLHMLLASQDALNFLQGMDETAFHASRLHQNAVIPWSEVVGMRHRLIHGYAEVRLDVVWAVATQRLPQLLEALRPLLPDENNPAQH